MDVKECQVFCFVKFSLGEASKSQIWFIMNEK